MPPELKYFLTLLVVFLLALCAMMKEARAVDWENAPLACLPMRAVIWKDDTTPELCHCPPQNMCPQPPKISPADVSFNATVYVGGGVGNVSFTLSGTDIANYYGGGAGTFTFANSPNISFTTPGYPHNAPYAPFDPSQIFVMQDNASYACPNGIRSGNWGAIQDYIAPVARQYLIQKGINYNGSFTEDGADAFCSRYNNLSQYNVTVKVSETLAAWISHGSQLPPSFLNQCCPAPISCPAGQEITVSDSNAISCQETVNTSRLGCLLEGTPVLTASGKNKNVEDIKLGDHLKGRHGDVTVVAINKFTQNADEMYSFNGGKAFITAEHPVLTTHGWKSINPKLTTVKSGIGSVGKLSAGDEIITKTGTLKITSIGKHPVHAPATAYNFSVRGGDGFIANDIVVKGFSQVEIHY
jgi:hypothetical protein